MDFFKKVEETEIVQNTEKSMFTYSVNMIVSVFAEDETKAREQLDQQGGYVSYRQVELKNSQSIYSPDSE